LIGRCRACRSRISIQYPIVETVNAVGYLASLWTIDHNWTTVFKAENNIA